LARRFAEVDVLASVAYPFQLRLYRDYQAGILSAEDFAAIEDILISYLFRRSVCRIPTNSLNKTFATLAQAIDVDHYVESVGARLLTLPDYRRFPGDEEFEEALRTTDLYNFKRRNYLFRKLENHDHKEPISIAEYTIEHIMPQNANRAWRTALGENWKADHERLLHTLGNLTLTGYNPEYSDRAFKEKRDMKGGFRESKLHLNAGLEHLDTWNAASIDARAKALAGRALQIWPRPEYGDALLDRYREQFNDAKRFDWSLTHSILQNIPEGRWTSYYNLAGAVGTSAQAVAGHVSRCSECVHGYRVLTWDGKVADEFHWSDANDNRNPVDVLRSEGITFINGVADPEQQLEVDELLELVGEDEL
jgi:alkylated DNA nucleotide flippase Atl1